MNVGTTIAIMTIPIKFSKGEIFSPLCIFEKQYYRYMGEFFLTCGWYTAGVLMAMIFLVVPGIVLGIIWSQALYLVLDKGVNPAKALSLSNKMTYGNKWIIFAVMFVVYIAFLVASLLLTWIPFIGVIIAFCLMVIYMAMILGCSGMIYGKLLEYLTEEDLRLDRVNIEKDAVSTRLRRLFLFCRLRTFSFFIKFVNIRHLFSI